MKRYEGALLSVVTFASDDKLYSYMGIGHQHDFDEDTDGEVEYGLNFDQKNLIETNNPNYYINNDSYEYAYLGVIYGGIPNIAYAYHVKFKYTSGYLMIAAGYNEDLPDYCYVKNTSVAYLYDTKDDGASYTKTLVLGPGKGALTYKVSAVSGPNIKYNSDKSYIQYSIREIGIYDKNGKTPSNGYKVEGYTGNNVLAKNFGNIMVSITPSNPVKVDTYNITFIQAQKNGSSPASGIEFIINMNVEIEVSFDMSARNIPISGWSSTTGIGWVNLGYDEIDFGKVTIQKRLYTNETIVTYNVPIQGSDKWNTLVGSRSDITKLGCWEAQIQIQNISPKEYGNKIIKVS